MSNGEVLYVIHDTNKRDMPEVASYTATNIDVIPGVAVIMFRNGTDLVAVHHLAPGHSIIPVIPEDADEEDAVTPAYKYLVNDAVEVLYYAQWRKGRVINIYPHATDAREPVHYQVRVDGETLLFTEVDLRRPEN